MELGLNKYGIYTTPLEKEMTCEKHGTYISKCYMRDIWSRCPACMKEEEQEEKRREQDAREEEAKRAWMNRLHDACIPERFQERALESYLAETDGQRKALEFAKRYAEGFDDVMRTGRCAIFIGKPGTGKTHLAIGIALHIIKQGRTALFTSVLRAIRRVKDTWAKNADESESDAIAAFTFPDLLILDEVGVQFGSDFERQVLFDIINERYERRKPTILISNLPAEELARYLGDRVTDRLREDGGKLIVFDWDSHRRKK